MLLVDLLASIDLTNNGYIFVPTGVELAVAKANPDVVDVRCGRIYRSTTPTELFPWSADRKFQRCNDDADYEGAILSRQEKWLFG